MNFKNTQESNFDHKNIYAFGLDETTKELLNNSANKDDGYSYADFKTNPNFKNYSYLNLDEKSIKILENLKNKESKKENNSINELNIKL